MQYWPISAQNNCVKFRGRTTCACVNIIVNVHSTATAWSLPCLVTNTSNAGFVNFPKQKATFWSSSHNSGLSKGQKGQAIVYYVSKKQNIRVFDTKCDFFFINVRKASLTTVKCFGSCQVSSWTVFRVVVNKESTKKLNCFHATEFSLIIGTEMWYGRKPRQWARTCGNITNGSHGNTDADRATRSQWTSRCVWQRRSEKGELKCH